jgi:hypothetical protein
MASTFSDRGRMPLLSTRWPKNVRLLTPNMLFNNDTVLAEPFEYQL